MPKVYADNNTKNHLEQPGIWNAIGQSIEQWGSAWSSQNLNLYMASYSTKFISERKLNYQQWLTARKKRFNRKSNININIDDIKLELISDIQAKVTFKQQYQDNNYQDSVIKALTLELENQRWLITRETQLKI